MGKHAPGPWDMNPAFDNKSFLIWDARGGSVVFSGTVGVSGDEFLYGITSRANARLIAAAPDLLEACQLARHICEEGNALQKMLDAAIAKATA